MGAQQQSNPDILSKIDVDINGKKDTISSKEIADFIKDKNNYPDIKKQFIGENISKFKDELKNYTIDTEIKKDTTEYFNSEAGKKFLWESEDNAKAAIKILMYCEKVEATPVGNVVKVPTDAEIQARYLAYTTESVKPYVGTGDIREIKREGDSITISDKNNAKITLPFKNGKFEYNERGGVKTATENISLPASGKQPIHIIGDKAYKIDFKLGQISCEEVQLPALTDLTDLAAKVGAVLEKPNLAITGIKFEASGTFNKMYRVTTNEANVSFCLDANLSPEGEKVGETLLDFSTVREKIYNKKIDAALNKGNHAFLKLPNGQIYVVETENPDQFKEKLKNLETEFSSNTKKWNSGKEAVYAYYKAVETLCMQGKAQRVSSIVDIASMTAGGMQLLTKDGNSPFAADRDEKILQAHDKTISYVEAKLGKKRLEAFPNAIGTMVYGDLRGFQVDGSTIKETSAENTIRKDVKKIEGDSLNKEFADYTADAWKKKNVSIKTEKPAGLVCSDTGFIAPQISAIQEAVKSSTMVKMKIGDGEAAQESYLPIKEISEKQYADFKNIQKNFKEPLTIKVGNAFVCISNEKIYAMGDEAQIKKIQEAGEGTEIWGLLTSSILTSAVTLGIMQMGKQDRQNVGNGIEQAGGWSLGKFKKFLDWTGKLDLRVWEKVNTFGKGNLLGMIVTAYTGQLSLESKKEQIAQAKSEIQSGPAMQAISEVQLVKETEKPAELQKLTKQITKLLPRINTADYVTTREYLGQKLLCFANIDGHKAGNTITEIKQSGENFLISTKNEKGVKLQYSIDATGAATVVESSAEEKGEPISAAEIAKINTEYDAIMKLDLSNAHPENQLAAFKWYKKANTPGVTDVVVLEKATKMKDLLSNVSEEALNKIRDKELSEQLNPQNHLYIKMDNQVLVVNLGKTENASKIKALVDGLENSLQNDKQAVATLLYIVQNYETKTVSQVYKEAESLCSVGSAITQSATEKISMSDTHKDEKYLSLYQSTAQAKFKVTNVSRGSLLAENVVNSLKNAVPGLGIFVKDADMASVKSDIVDGGTKSYKAKDRWKNDQGKVLKYFGGTKALKDFTAANMQASEEDQSKDPGISISEGGLLTMNTTVVDSLSDGAKVKVQVGKEGIAYLASSVIDASDIDFCKVSGISKEHFKVLPPLMMTNGGVITCLVNGKLITMAAKKKDVKESTDVEFEGKKKKYSRGEVALCDLLASSATVAGKLAYEKFTAPKPVNLPTVDVKPNPDPINPDPTPNPDLNKTEKPSSRSKLAHFLDNPYMGYLTGAFTTGLIFNSQIGLKNRELAKIQSQMENGPALQGTIESQIKTRDEAIADLKDLLATPERCARPAMGLDFGAQKRNRIGHLLASHPGIGKAEFASKLLAYEVKSITKDGDKYVILFDDGAVQGKSTLKGEKKVTIDLSSSLPASSDLVVKKAPLQNPLQSAVFSRSSLGDINKPLERSTSAVVKNVPLPLGAGNTPTFPDRSKLTAFNGIVQKKGLSGVPNNLSQAVNLSPVSPKTTIETKKNSLEIKPEEIALKIWKTTKPQEIATAINAIQNPEIKKTLMTIAKVPGKEGSQQLQAYLEFQQGLEGIVNPKNLRNGDFDGWTGKETKLGIDLLATIKTPRICAVDFTSAESRKNLILAKTSKDKTLWAAIEKSSVERTA